MVLHGYGSALCNKAHSVVNAPLVSTATEAHLKQAGQLFQSAAGVFRFLHDNLRGPWQPLPESVHPELLPEVCLLLAFYCDMNIERLAIRNGILRGDTFRLLTRLSVSVQQKLAFIRDTLVRMGPSHLALSREFLMYIHFGETYQEAITYKLLGLSYRERRKPGKALAAMRRAVEKIKEIKEATREYPLLKDAVYREFEEMEISMANIERFNGTEIDVPEAEFPDIATKLPLAVKDFVLQKQYVPPRPFSSLAR
jgi:hypothetical protein